MLPRLPITLLHGATSPCCCRRTGAHHHAADAVPVPEADESGSDGGRSRGCNPSELPTFREQQGQCLPIATFEQMSMIDEHFDIMSKYRMHTSCFITKLADGPFWLALLCDAVPL